MKHKVFIDGSAGTTGLKIYERFRGRDDISVINIDEDKRKDADEKRRLINESDVTFLCLPDEAARESVAMVENDTTIIIDTSTAHRTDDGWRYGFPELSPGHRAGIAAAKRIAVPGCHATGFSALIYPLMAAGLLDPDYPLAVTSLTGYSGGGKQMIAEYENGTRDAEYGPPRLYALGQRHKHLPEMVKVCGLRREPLFSPIVADYYAGMVVFIPLHGDAFTTAMPPAGLYDFYAGHYRGMVNVLPPYVDGTAPPMLAAGHMAGRDGLNIIITGHAGRLVLCAQFDNLGKGASGAAVQCMNIALGYREDEGLLV